MTATPLTALQRRLLWRRVSAGLTQTNGTTVVLSTFTANPLEALVGAALHTEGLSTKMVTGPYDQIISECLVQGSETDLLQPNTVVVWPRLEDLWRAQPLPLVDQLSDYSQMIVDVAVAAADAAERWKATLVFVLPAQPELRPLGVGDAGNPVGVIAAWESARLDVRTVLAGRSGVLVADAEQSVRCLGVRAATDPRTLTAARVPYTDALFCLVADDIARLLRLAKFGARKVAIVDADNTLWGGVVGEDGADGIDLLDNGPGEAFRAFQSWLLELRRSGTIIGVASKNNEADLWEAFGRSEMVLNQAHLAAWRVNWSPKSQNIAEMIDELNLGLASAVFIDDNPLELSEVGESLPEVALLQMPIDASYWMREIAESGLLDRLPPTNEDLGRAESYSAETQRRTVRERMTPEEYLRSLEIAVLCSDPLSSDIARLSQLVAKTNQFTLGGYRHSESELRGLLADSQVRIRMISVIDKFGNYGVVGATIVRSTSSGSLLDTFVLSCRAMGRGVEEAMMADVCELSETAVRVNVLLTPRNLPGRTFFESIGAFVGEEALLSSVRWPVHVKRTISE